MNLAHHLLTALALLALAPAAAADRFYFGSAEDAEKMAEGEPDFIEGVLLGEEEGMYVIRVEGGEIRVPKAQVREIETTDLTVEGLEQRETRAQEYLAEANELRRELIAAERADREQQRREVRAAEAQAQPRQGAFIEASARVFESPGFITQPVFDPILGIAYPAGTNTYLIQKELGGIIRRKLQKQTREQLLRL